MAERPWTPGPWVARDGLGEESGVPRHGDGSEAVLVYEIDGCETHPVADVSCNHTCRFGYEAEANARLIAAAPELFEALEPFAREVEFWADDAGDDLELNEGLGQRYTLGDFRRALAAIKKALGESNGLQT